MEENIQNINERKRKGRRKFLIWTNTEYTNKVFTGVDPSGSYTNDGHIW